MRHLTAFLLCALGILPGLPAHADAWLRAAGAGFASVSHYATEFGDTVHDSLLIEYGVTPGLTFGVEAGVSPGGTWSGMAYGRIPLGNPDRATRFAAEFGAGITVDGNTALRLSLAAGRGIETRFGPGWLSLDSRADHVPGLKLTNLDIDATAGLHLGDKSMAILQLQARADTDGAPTTLTIAPSYVRQISESLNLELGVSAGVIGNDDLRLKLGTWLSF